MKSRKTLSIIGVTLSSILIIASLALLVFNRIAIKDATNPKPEAYEPANVNSIDNTDLREEIEKVSPPEGDIVEKKDSVGIRESGWIPNWGFNLGLESLRNNKEIIDTVMPVLYTVDKEGNVVSRGVSETNIRNLIDYCKENNIRIIPTVGSYDYDAMSAAFKSEDSYQKQIETIVSEIGKYSFDGIDLDYEMINISERDNFLQFLRDLKTELQRKRKILSVTVFPQWEDATYTDHQETRVVQDYMEIGEIANEVRIMAYDYTLQSAKVAGPIAPLPWVEEILEYSTNIIPKEKIWLGIHLYGYQWSENKTVAFTYTTTRTILNNPNINNIFMRDIGEGYAEFGCDGEERCKAYYQDIQGVQMRRELAKEYEIAGVAYWRLGGELDILK